MFFKKRSYEMLNEKQIKIVDFILENHIKKQDVSADMKLFFLLSDEIKLDEKRENLKKLFKKLLNKINGNEVVEFDMRDRVLIRGIFLSAIRDLEGFIPIVPASAKITPERVEAHNITLKIKSAEKELQEICDILRDHDLM